MTRPDDRSHPPATGGRNAFDRAFLDRFSHLDDADLFAGSRADTAGPWQVLPASPDGWGCYGLGAEEAELTFHEREYALLAAAALPSVGYQGRFTYGPPDRSGRSPILDHGTEIGTAPYLDPDLLQALDVLGALAADPASLAHLLEVAGPNALRRTGEILTHRLKGR